MEWIHGGGVQGDGFVVTSGFNFAVYREGNSVVKLAIKRGFRGTQHLVVLPHDAFRRFEGALNDIAPAERERMRANFVAAMEFSGAVVE